MKKVYLTPRREPDSELSQFVLDAYNWARDFRDKKGKDDHFKSVENYLEAKSSCCDYLVNLGEKKDESITVRMDAISTKVDVFLAVGTDAVIQVDKPWVIMPTRKPETPSNVKDEIVDGLAEIIGNRAAEASQGDPVIFQQLLLDVLDDRDGAYDFIREKRDEMLELARKQESDLAEETAKAFDELIEDSFQDSNWKEEFDSFLYSYGLKDYAVLKTPQFVIGFDEIVSARQVKEIQKLKLFHENINPENYFCSEDSTWNDHGTFEMDASSISLNELKESKDFDGFNAKEIDRAVEYFSDTGRQWLVEDWDCTKPDLQWKSYEHIPIIKFYGRVDGVVLDKWISSADKKKFHGGFDKSKSYESVIWKIHEFIIFGCVYTTRKTQRPYKVATYSKRGFHKYDGRGLFSLLMPYQVVIDSYHEMLLENAKLSAGGIIGYNRKKIDAQDFDPKDIRGGARIPVKSSDVDGGNDRPIFEISFDSHVSEFFTVLLQLERKMDEVSQLPATALGFGGASSFRSTGIASIIQANSNKSIIKKILEIEKQVVKPTILNLISYHLWNTDDRRILEGAIDVSVAGYSEIIRNQDKQQNLDLFLQNVVGFLNARLQLLAQGQDVSGLDELLDKYAVQAGLSGAESILGRDAGVDHIAGDLASGLVPTQPVGLDGRSQPPIDINAQI